MPTNGIAYLSPPPLAHTSLTAHRRRLFALGLYASGFLLIYASFQFSARMNRLRLWFDPGWPTISSLECSLLFAAGCTLLIGGYALLLHASTEFRTAPAGTAAKYVAVLFVLFMLLPSFLTEDIVSYYQQGWVSVVQHANPFAVPPDAFADFPGRDLGATANTHITAPYGPLWMIVSELVVRLCPYSTTTGIVIFKLVAMLSACVIVLLILKISALLALPDRTWLMLSVCANPLFLLDGPGQGHNDIFTLMLMLSGIWLYLKYAKLPWIGLTVIFLAALSKPYGIIGFGIAIYHMFYTHRFGKVFWLNMLYTGLASVTCMLVVSAPYVKTTDDLLLIYGMWNNRIPYHIQLTPVGILHHIITYIATVTGLSIYEALVSQVTTLTMIVLGALAMLQTMALTRRPVAILASIGPVYAIGTLVFGYWRQWYVLWPLSFSFLLAGTRSWYVLIAYSSVALFTYVVTRSAGVSFLVP